MPPKCNSKYQIITLLACLGIIITERTISLVLPFRHFCILDWFYSHVYPHIWVVLGFLHSYFSLFLLFSALSLDLKFPFRVYFFLSSSMTFFLLAISSVSCRIWQWILLTTDLTLTSDGWRWPRWLCMFCWTVHCDESPTIFSRYSLTD